MATKKELADFLMQAERRAFRHALYAVRQEEAAFDIVQDAMIKLSEKYGDHPVAEFPLLFQTILKNTITDYFRQQKIQDRCFYTGLPEASSENDDTAFDFLEIHAVDNEQSAFTQCIESGDSVFERQQIFSFIEEALQKLPARQREAFLIRYWEEMNVEETAQIMGCSEGSVKTHCFRAIERLSQALKAKGVSL